ncbi:hypothetical protein [Shimia sp. MIT910701]|uniref:hypothetical protein n=1 Tax=Shimia sp. MIT910701 TaxID=3096987 RepID=UPI00399AC9E0
MVEIRGIEFQANTDNDMGLEFYNLSHRYGFQCPNWPYFKDVQIDRKHYIVRRQSFWNQKRRELRECSAHRVGLIMLRVDCDASVALRMSSV